MIQIAGLIPFVLLSQIFNYLRYGGFWKSGQAVIVEQLNSDPLLAGLPLCYHLIILLFGHLK